jgi:hypothetical protein
MKLQKIAVIGLFALSFAGVSAGAAQAIDAPDGSQIIIDCAGGYEAVYTSDGSSGTCEPIATTYSEDISAYSENGADEQQVDVNGCWTNVDATGNAESYVCSRSAVPTLTSEEPIDPAVGCGTVVDENGVDNTVCADVMYSGGPVDDNGVPIMEKGIDLMSANGLAGPKAQDSSNILAALGVLIAAAAAFAIGLSKERSKNS